jgi:hypothetical protein
MTFVSTQKLFLSPKTTFAPAQMPFFSAINDKFA